MSRARDNANLGAQAESGLDASDITSGALPVGVTGGSGLDAVSPANLASGVLPVGVTGGSGLTALGTVASGTIVDKSVTDISRFGASCRMYFTSTVTGAAATTVYLTGYTQDFNDDTALFTQGSTSTNGITVAVAGWYRYDLHHYTWNIQYDSYTTVKLAKDASSNFNETYCISWRVANSNGYTNLSRSNTIYLATGTYGHYHFHSGGTLNIQGSTTGTSLCLTYLRA